MEPNTLMYSFSDEAKNQGLCSVSGLLPCPFCGKTPETGALGDGRFTIKCYECGIVMIQDRKDKLKALWNRRQ